MKRMRLLVVILCLALLTNTMAFAIGQAADASLSPVEGWYQISTAEELVALSRGMSYFEDGVIPVDARIRLMADLDMAGVDGFLPIGDNSGSDGYFSGEFDGGGHVISNLKLKASDDWNKGLKDPEASLYMGFFGYVAGGYIHDLGLKNIDFETEGSNAGGLAGMMVDGTIERCFVSGSIQAGGAHVGAFNGRQRIGAKIQDCYAFVDLLGNDGVGGMVGSQLSNEPAGVLVKNCLYAGNVEAIQSEAGGVAGRIDPAAGNAFISCVSLADSVMSAEAAGIFSSSDPGAVTVENVLVADKTQVGGTAVTPAPKGVSVLPFQDFSLQATYPGWDFETVWVMRESEGGAWPALRAFSLDQQPAAPWTAQASSSPDDGLAGYAVPAGGGASPRSVTYLWDSFGQPKGQFSARINWVTAPAVTDTVLLYAPVDEFFRTGRYAMKTMGTSSLVDLSENTLYTGTDNISLAGVRSHKAQTETLEPDTEYVFCVGNGDRNVSIGRFKTPPADIRQFDFIWITDSQTNGASLESTLEAYNQRAKTAYDMARADFPDAAFILNTGDSVNQTFDTWQWDGFFESVKASLDRFPLYMVAGNHEYDGNLAYTGKDETVDPGMSAIKGRFNAPENGAARYGGGAAGEEPLVSGMEKIHLDGINYFFQYGNTLFLMLENVRPGQDIEKQAQWLKSVVKNNPATWRVAALHASLFPGYRDQPDDYLAWTKAFDEAGIDVVLMGHEHLYLRTKLFSDGQILENGASGEGTVYITNNPGTQVMGYVYTDRPYTQVYSAELGMSYAALSIGEDGIFITAKGHDSEGNLVVVEDNALIADTPRVPRLSDYAYPPAAAPEAAAITDVTIAGSAKENQQLLAITQPRGAEARFQWQRLDADKQEWQDLQEGSQRKLTLDASLVGQQVRVVAVGTGDYEGTAASEPSKAVEPLVSDIPNEPGYAMDLDAVEAGQLPDGWLSEGSPAASTEMVGDRRALRIMGKEAFTLTIPFGAQRQVFDISYDLYVGTNGVYPNTNDRYYAIKMAFLDSNGEEVVMSQPMTWGDCGGEFYWAGLGGLLGIMKADGDNSAQLSPAEFFLNDELDAGKWHTVRYSFNFPEGTYTLTFDDQAIYTSPACTNSAFALPSGVTEISAIRFSDGLPEGGDNHASEADYAYANLIAGSVE